MVTHPHNAAAQGGGGGGKPRPLRPTFQHLKKGLGGCRRRRCRPGGRPCCPTARGTWGGGAPPANDRTPAQRLYGPPHTPACALLVHVVMSRGRGRVAPARPPARPCPHAVPAPYMPLSGSRGRHRPGGPRPTPGPPSLAAPLTVCVACGVWRAWGVRRRPAPG
jgi:hypothetical protein